MNKIIYYKCGALTTLQTLLTCYRHDNPALDGNLCAYVPIAWHTTTKQSCVVRSMEYSFIQHVWIYQVGSNCVVLAFQRLLSYNVGTAAIPFLFTSSAGIVHSLLFELIYRELQNWNKTKMSMRDNRPVFRVLMQTLIVAFR